MVRRWASSHCRTRCPSKKTSTPRRLGGRPGIFLHLVENFVLLDHAELGTGALLDGLKPLLEIAHLGVQRGVARLQTPVDFPLRGNLAIHLPDPEPASLAQPE